MVQKEYGRPGMMLAALPLAFNVRFDRFLRLEIAKAGNICILLCRVAGKARVNFIVTIQHIVLHLKVVNSGLSPASPGAVPDVYGL
ncbi:MAG: hypothetical protein U9P37_06025 [Pseudomonadota bacterium]|nr:hypothetical protein [Pseudomonadota bacterium]